MLLRIVIGFVVGYILTAIGQAIVRRIKRRRERRRHEEAINAVLIYIRELMHELNREEICYDKYDTYKERIEYMRPYTIRTDMAYADIRELGYYTPEDANLDFIRRAYMVANELRHKEYCPDISRHRDLLEFVLGD